jgi:dTDP-4-dehydrorhamnose 3,5-epimerase
MVTIADSSKTFRSDALRVTLDFCADNHAYSSERGVLRGPHYQDPPRPQSKLVRCVKGSILDVSLDIRTGSPTFDHHVAIELSAGNWI